MKRNNISSLVILEIKGCEPLELSLGYDLYSLRYWVTSPRLLRFKLASLRLLTDPSFSTSEPSETLDELSVVPSDLPEAVNNLTEAPNYLLKAPNHLSYD